MAGKINRRAAYRQAVQRFTGTVDLQHVPRVALGAAPVDLAIEGGCTDGDEALVIIRLQFEAGAGRQGLEEFEAGSGLVIGRADLAGRPARRHCAQPVDMGLHWITIIGGDQDRGRRAVGRGNVARGGKNGGVAVAEAVPGVEDLHDDVMDPRRIVVRVAHPGLVAGIVPGEEPGLLQDPVPGPYQVLAIGQWQEGRSVIGTKGGLFRFGPDTIAPGGDPAEPVRVALQRGDQDDRTRVEAIGRDPLQSQGGDELDNGIGIIVDVGGGLGEWFRLAKAGSIRGDAGEVRTPALHQLLIFAA